MPLNVEFNNRDFFRPPKPTQDGQDFMFSLNRKSIGINNNNQKELTNMSIIGKMIDGCLICEVRNQESS